MRRLVSLLLMLTCTACFARGGGTADPNGDPSVVRPVQLDPATAEASMTSGTEVARGVIVHHCEGDLCRTVPGARPAGVIVVVAARPIVTVALEREPMTVEGVVRRGDRVVARTPLLPGTLVAWTPRLRTGRSELRIVATWRDGSTTWTFAIRRRG